jgi:hypothetical protein
MPSGNTRKSIFCCRFCEYADALSNAHAWQKSCCKRRTHEVGVGWHRYFGLLDPFELQILRRLHCFAKKFFVPQSFVHLLLNWWLLMESKALDHCWYSAQVWLLW